MWSEEKRKKQSIAVSENDCKFPVFFKCHHRCFSQAGAWSDWLCKFLTQKDFQWSYPDSLTVHTAIVWIQVSIFKWLFILTSKGPLIKKKNFRPFLYSLPTSQPQISNVVCSVLFLFSCLLIDRTASYPATALFLILFKMTELQDTYPWGTVEHGHKRSMWKCAVTNWSRSNFRCRPPKPIQQQWAKSATSTLIVLITNSLYFIHYELRQMCILLPPCFMPSTNQCSNDQRMSIAYLWCK